MHNKLKTPDLIYRVTLLVLTLLTFFLIGYKLFFLNYEFSDLIPTIGYDVEVSIQVSGHEDDISVSTYLPASTSHQNILDERSSSSVFTSQIEIEGLNRIATWKAPAVSGTHIIKYNYFVQAEHVIYTVDKNISIEETLPSYLHEYLKEEEGIQVNDPLIEQTLFELFGDTRPDTLEALQTIHDYLQHQFKNRNFSGFTDALTALKLKEASCNGKGRLFLALTRKIGLPSRLVGGLILKQGSKKTSHQWVEVYVRGHWIPFDTINDYFAEVPENYLRLYYGDKVLFKHSTNVNFKYLFNITKKLVPRSSFKETMYSSSLNAFNMYKIFESIGISQNLLKIILMIPLGALVVVVFRNVIGIETFGTFLPALIATAARETGVWWGLLGFLFIILLSAMVRKFLDYLQLLHSPKMAIMLTVVVIAMLLMTVVSVQSSLFDLAHISLFPIAILAITAERFAIIQEEQGLMKALRISFFTAIVILAAYAVMSSLFMQSLIIAFPELLLFLIVLNLWLGKWVGMRLSEYIRFRKLIFKAQV